MPRKLNTAGKPTDRVPIQITVPLWLKQAAAAKAAADGRDLTGWMIVVLKQATGAREPRK